MTWGMALIISNFWFAAAAESRFWMYFFAIFWLGVVLLGFVL